MKRYPLPVLVALVLILAACRLDPEPYRTTTLPEETTTSAAPTTTSPPTTTTTTEPDVELSGVALGFNNAEQGVIAPDGTPLLVVMRLDSVEVVRGRGDEVVTAGGAGRVATPAITAGATRVVVAWAERTQGREAVIKAAVSEDSGRSFGPAQTLGEGGGPSLVASGDEVVAVWHTAEEGAGDGDITVARLGPGSDSWTEVGPVDESAAAPLWASVDAQGSRLVVTWRDNRTGEYTVWSRTSDDLGVTWNPEVQVVTTKSGDPDVCLDPSGAIWLGYHGGGDVHLTKSTDGGSSFLPAARVGEGWFAHVSCDSGVTAVAWEQTTAPPKAPHTDKAAGWATFASELHLLDHGAQGGPEAVAATIVPTVQDGLDLVWIVPDTDALTGSLLRFPIP